MTSRASQTMKVSVPDNFTRQHAAGCLTMQHTCPYPLLYLSLSSGNSLLLLSSGNCLLYMMCLSHARRILRLGAVMSDAISLLAACSKGSGNCIAAFLVHRLYTAIQQLSLACRRQRHVLIHCFLFFCQHSAPCQLRLPLEQVQAESSSG